MRFGFFPAGLLIFVLPMLINIVYVLLPPRSGTAAPNGRYPVWEGIEQATRILYLLALCGLIGNKALSFRSPLFFLALLCLILYYAGWLRYFRGGRDLALIGRPLLWVPQPLAVFPVLYFFFAALWTHNPVAGGIMILFGVAHNVVTYKNEKAATP